MTEPLLVAEASTGLHLLPQYAGRCALIASAAGGGKQR